ncbi:hypothetical protein [Parapedobacter koreensis]|uniref:Uncharacterized protein n=1 Tax=Parapedobacter koreensis TaxID=332977 RepID=A0A1H7PTR6_9SPHI|nr:hypothetical protein [Parapedobacter koreensis]SEL38848.1 hypothetical protein SAMN05421740_1052 [Parapedobacter koreensis]
MFTITSYQEYAKDFGIRLKSYEGILMYVDNGAEIPEQVLFIPVSINRKKTMMEAVQEILASERQTAYELYFQAVKWIMPDAGKKLRQLKHIDINYNHRTAMKLVFGKFTFTDKPIDLDVKEDETEYGITLAIDGQIYSIQVRDLPFSYGYHKFFERL